MKRFGIALRRVQWLLAALLAALLAGGCASSTRAAQLAAEYYNLGNGYYELGEYPKAVACLRRAVELGCKVVVSTDAHSPRGLEHMRFGVDQARRGWVEARDVLNVLPLGEFEAWLGRRTQ